MSAVVEPEITLLELVEALSKQADSDAETVCAMVESYRIHLVGQFDDRHAGTLTPATVY